MIVYDPRKWGGFNVLFHRTGSALFSKHSLPFATLSGLLTEVIVWGLRDQINQVEDTFITNPNSYFGAISFIIGFLVVYRAQVAYDRGQDRLSVNIRSRILRWMRLYHELATEEIQGFEFSPRFPRTYLTTQEAMLLSKERKRPLVVMAWLSDTLMRYRDKFMCEAPVFSRLFTLITEANTHFNDCRRISETPFPFVFAQITMMMIVVWSILTPFVTAAFVPQGYGFGFCISFFSSWMLFGVNEAASQLESPFDDAPNDLPILYYTHAFHDDISAVKFLNPPCFFEGDEDGSVDGDDQLNCIPLSETSRKVNFKFSGEISDEDDDVTLHSTLDNKDTLGDFRIDMDPPQSSHPSKLISPRKKEFLSGFKTVYDTQRLSFESDKGPNTVFSLFNLPKESDSTEEVESTSVTQAQKKVYTPSRLSGKFFSSSTLDRKLLRDSMLKGDLDETLVNHSEARPINVGQVADDFVLLQKHNLEKSFWKDSVLSSQNKSTRTLDSNRSKQSFNGPKINKIIYNTVAGTDGVVMAKQLAVEREYQQRLLAKNVQKQYEKRRDTRRMRRLGTQIKTEKRSYTNQHQSDTKDVKTIRKRYPSARLSRFRSRKIPQSLKTKPFSNLRHHGVFGRFR